VAGISACHMSHVTSGRKRPSPKLARKLKRLGLYTPPPKKGRAAVKAVETEGVAV